MYSRWRCGEGNRRRDLLHHSDGGVQCTALSFGKRLEVAGIVPSMGRAGSALDIAISESFVSTLKYELIHPSSLPDPGDRQEHCFRVSGSLLQPRRRLRSSLGYMSPLGLRGDHEGRSYRGLAKNCPLDRGNSTFEGHSPGA
jgi:transposase InsO family protein